MSVFICHLCSYSKGASEFGARDYSAKYCFDPEAEGDFRLGSSVCGGCAWKRQKNLIIAIRKNLQNKTKKNLTPQGHPDRLKITGCLKPSVAPSQSEISGRFDTFGAF